MKFLANIKVIFVIIFSFALLLSCESQKNVEKTKINIEHQPPKIVSIDIEPTAPEEGDEIICTVELFDPGLDWKQVEFIWTVKNEIVYSYVIYITDITSPNIECESTLDYYEADLKPGEMVKCKVTIEDKRGNKDRKTIFVLVEPKKMKDYSDQ
ncbi:MAG: hypothetical protein ABH830_03820 [Patescibacteria group bacterium]